MYMFQWKKANKDTVVKKKESGVNIWNLLWLPRPLINLTDQANISTFPNT